MSATLVLIFIILSFLVTVFIVWVWKMVNWVILNPKKIEKCLRKQGLSGNPYRFLHGDTKEMAAMIKAANSKPIKLNDDIVPRVLPFQHHIVNKYGKNSFFWTGPSARVLVMEPELIREILTNNSTFKKPTPNPLVRYLVSGLAGYEDEKWAKHRRLVNPAFHLDKLKNMVPAMYLSCKEMISKWELLMEGKNSLELDVQTFLNDLTSDVISRTAFGSSHEQGKKIVQLQKDQAELTRQVLQSVYIPGWRFIPTRANRRMKEINKELGALFKDIIRKREMAMKVGEGDDHGDNLLSMLLKSNHQEIQEQGLRYGLSIEEVIEECKTFYFSGQESTSNLLTWTMILLSIHQPWQLRASEEVKQVFGETKPDFDGLNHLKIVTMILYEVLRLYPPSIIFTRTVYEETKIGKLTLPPGVHLMLPVILVHRNPELWGEDANEFKPERFSEGISKATKNKLSFFPFSWGPRICIGNNFALMEAKITLAIILQRYHFHLSPSYIHAPSYVVTHKPQHGAHLILHKL